MAGLCNNPVVVYPIYCSGPGLSLLILFRRPHFTQERTTGSTRGLTVSSRLLDMTTTDRTTEVLSFLRCKLSPSQKVKDLLYGYKHAQPFPHLVLDNLFPNEILEPVLAELPPASSEKWVNERDPLMIKSNLRSAVDLEEHGYAFASILHSAAFLYFLSEITGIKALLPDPYLGGAGYHVMHEGGKFEVHADRNTDYTAVCGAGWLCWSTSTRPGRRSSAVNLNCGIGMQADVRR